MSKPLITKKKLREIAKECNLKFPIRFEGYHVGRLLEDILEASGKMNVYSLEYYKTLYEDLQENEKIFKFVKRALDQITNKKPKLLQQWRCAITSVNSKSCTVFVKDCTNPKRLNEEWLVKTKELQGATKEQLKVGDIFHWNIYEDETGGFDFELSRKTYTKKDIENSRKRAKKLKNLLSDKTQKTGAISKCQKN
jgi:hypothetical protein